MLQADDAGSRGGGDHHAPRPITCNYQNHPFVCRLPYLDFLYWTFIIRTYTYDGYANGSP